MHFIHLITWAAAGVFASPIADRDSSPRNAAVRVKNEHNAESGPSSVALPTPSSASPSQPSSVVASAPSYSVTVTVTPTPSRSSSNPLDGECTSTLYLNLFTNPINPPTRTVHETTVTSTSSIDCAGCKFLATINIGGLGPVLQGANITTDITPATVINFACSA